jgi:hypothetical protein
MSMKHLAVCSVLFVLMFGQGCTSNDRTPAGPEGSLNTPESAPATASGSATQPSGQADPAANGGSSLPASAPYQGNGAPVSQNLNPAPFLAASQPQGQASGSTTALDGLTSRADGTMRGPNDQPAASTGWGSPAQTAQPASSGKAIRAKPTRNK